jgi:hypothetical protein
MMSEHAHPGIAAVHPAVWAGVVLVEGAESEYVQAWR